jgi:hypothetical protein
MARALRLAVAGGRYHVPARGNAVRPIFRQDRDRLHFLELLAHADVLMDNHYHLVPEPPEANLSRAGRMPLGQMAAVVSGCDYTTVAKALSRFQ